MITVAALYVQRGGVYWDLDGVDPWDESRDARTYAGPHPVVAHPPCNLWVNFAALNYRRYGGEHNIPGNDGGLFAAALAAVRHWGGVLEHPASSNVWSAHGLTAPTSMGWQSCGHNEWVAEVWQSAYGHKARKRTWLYAVTANPPPVLDCRAVAGVAQIGWQFVGTHCRGEIARKSPLSKREASATPPAFRDLLLSIARGAR